MPVLMQGGFSFSEALSMVAVAASSDALKSCVTRLMVELSSGTPISSAFAAAADTWPSVVSLALSAVAGTGKTADILLHLADAFDADQRYRNDVGQALLVPVITGVGALVVLAGALYWCADQLGDHTSRLLFVGRWLYEYGLLVMILSAMVIVALVYSVRRSKVASIFRDRLVLAIPFFGAVGGQSDAILFFTVIALLLRAGVPLVPALRSGKLLVSNAYWRQLMNRFINDLEQGISLREAVAHLPAVCAPPVFVAGVVTATDAQQLVVVCNNTAQLVALQRAQLLSRFLVVLQPALLLFIGLVLAGFLYIVTQALSMSCVSMGTL